ncbi:glutamyl-tRNA reductase [Chthoniobacter flavus]|uniref:glutamyl-tRNA reductase n=1 Tax=Chthoniobacter flavus TaxID=191863 RepID=UPI002351C28E|nr:glutamyl-tRNA reductase [Chthoniobacter flavus]
MGKPKPRRSPKQLLGSEGVSEVVVVSTCNRVEFYVAAEQAAQGFGAVNEFLTTRLAEPPGSAFFQLPTAAAVRHLFRVVSGLDSMVLGETEILGQVKKAYAAASAGKTTAKHLNKFFQRAFNVAKDVRTNTNITRGSVSVGSAAVELAEKIFGKLSTCHVMILGAGEMSELTAGALSARGVKSIFVANRSYDRAVTLAEKMKGKAIHFEDWPREFHDVDILIGSTAAPHHVLTAAQLGPIMRTRPDRPLFCIDLAVPRDIEPAVNDIEGVYLYDIDALQARADQSMNVRKQELVICEQMIERHAVEFGEWLAGGWTQAGVRYSEAVSGGQS